MRVGMPVGVADVELVNGRWNGRCVGESMLDGITVGKVEKGLRVGIGNLFELVALLG